MRHPALLPVEIAWVRPKQRHGALAGRPGSRRGARPCQCCAGGTPALPGGLPPMTPRHQRHNIAQAPGRRSSLKQLHPYSCLFVVRLHFQNENGWLLILSILCILVQSVENRFSTTSPLFPAGHEDSLFHPRMIRPVVGGGGPACLKHPCRIQSPAPPGYVPN